jgi:tetratricopeptide (TPR) repeat protein
MRRTGQALYFLLLTGLGWFSPAPAAELPKVYSSAELQAVLRERLTEAERTLISNPLESTADIARWAKELTKDATDTYDKVRRLYRACSTLPPNADHETAALCLTAAAAFTRGRAQKKPISCEGQIYLMTVMCRDVGVQANVAQVFRLLDGLRLDDDTPGQHICTAFPLKDRVRLADPAYHKFFPAPHHDWRTLDDVEVIALHSASRASVMMEQNKDLDAAKSLAEIALKLDPQCYLAHIALASYHSKKEDALGAVKAWQACVAIRPEFALARVGLASALNRAEQPDAALKEGLKALDLKPQSPNVLIGAYRALGVACMKSRRYKQAIPLWREVLNLNPNDETAKKMLAEAQKSLEEGK